MAMNCKELPQGAPAAEQTPAVDFRQQTYEVLSQVREPTPEEKEALKDRGIVFLFVESKSYAQVVREDPDHFWDEELDYTIDKPALRDYVLPVAVEVGLNPDALAMPGGFGESQRVQLEMIERRSQELQQEFPDARVIMLPVTGYAQADRAYKEITGDVLFRNYFARGLDMLSPGYVAIAGRHQPAYRFNVHDWRDCGFDIVGAVPAVVFVKK